MGEHRRQRLNAGEPDARAPFLELRRRLSALEPDLRDGLARMVDSGRVLEGPELARFEEEWAAFSGGIHAVGVGSGTDALRLTLVALGVGAGDEVLIPAFTAIPTAAAVCAAGATPVPVDVDRQTAALDHDAARAALTSSTRAAIVVHLYGRPATVPELGVPVIEDAAHAHGALDGVSGVAAAYSFYPTKNLGGIGDGGAVVTDDDDLATRIASLRMHGRDGSGVHRLASTNSRLSELGALALRAGLGRLEDGNRRRREIAALYRESAPSLLWQADHERHVQHLCVARVADREAFRASLPCETGVHYPRAVVDEPAYARFARDPVPEAQRWAAECVSLPCYPELRDRELQTIATALAGALS